MNSHQGYLRKMRVRLDNPVCYAMRVGDQEVALNPLVGKPIVIEHTGSIRCIHCLQPTRKSFSQGYCYRCFQTLAECDGCIMDPVRCHFHLGTCRDPDWGRSYCFQSHVVYMANTSGTKIGITRDRPVETRWIDQGATQAGVVAHVASRKAAGELEHLCRQYMSDRTAWQRMLKGEADRKDLTEQWRLLREQIGGPLEQMMNEYAGHEFILHNEISAVHINYPVDQYPQKVRSLNLEREGQVGGVLHGIKGQYLMLDAGVINIRKYTGYEIILSIE